MVLKILFRFLMNGVHGTWISGMSRKISGRWRLCRARIMSYGLSSYTRRKILILWLMWRLKAFRRLFRLSIVTVRALFCVFSRLMLLFLLRLRNMVWYGGRLCLICLLKLFPMCVVRFMSWLLVFLLLTLRYMVMRWLLMWQLCGTNRFVLARRPLLIVMLIFYICLLLIPLGRLVRLALVCLCLVRCNRRTRMTCIVLILLKCLKLLCCNCLVP